MSKKKLSKKEMKMRCDLEIIRDEVCGLYGPDCEIIYELDPHEREVLMHYLDRMLELVENFQSQYDLEFTAEMCKSLFKPTEGRP